MLHPMKVKDIWSYFPYFCFVNLHQKKLEYNYSLTFIRILGQKYIWDYNVFKQVIFLFSNSSYQGYYFGKNVFFTQKVYNLNTQDAAMLNTYVEWPALILVHWKPP